MELKIKITNIKNTKNYNFKPDRVTEIKQNIENIVNRIKNNVVLARYKGVNYEIIDKPNNIKLAELNAEVVTEIEREEPAFKVRKISITSETPEEILIHLKGEINV